MVMVKFSVTANGLADEDVYAVGNCVELGEWNHENAVRLTRYDQTDESTESSWYVTVEVSSVKRLEYRYFIGRMMSEPSASDTEHDDSVLTVQWWEGGPTPREVSLADASNIQMVDKFGIIGVNRPERGESNANDCWYKNGISFRCPIHFTLSKN